MRLEKNTTPSRQASGVASKSNHSVPRRRLTDEEWTAKCDEIAPQAIALFSVLAIIVTLLEVI
ncbi:MAG: hypothetical protein IKL97_03535 [Eggerthellaceae bacterium]|nr:hypothetical protein [Eggerthellaceae bacterium]